MPTTCHFFRRFNDRNVPKAEVDLGLLNGGFGGMVYQGVTESETTYIGRGAEERDVCGYGIPHAYIFLIISKFFSDFQ